MSDDKDAAAQAAAAEKAAQEAKDKAASDESKQTFPLSYVQELRQEAAAQRTRANDAEAQSKAAKEAADAATKKATEDIAAAQSLVKQASIQASVTTHAAKLGFVDPEDAVKLLDTSKVTFENGTVAGVEDALKALASNKPHLLGSRGAGDGPDKNGGKKPTSDMNAQIRKQAGVTPT